LRFQQLVYPFTFPAAEAVIEAFVQLHEKGLIYKGDQEKNFF
jgi:valyl-tRNA synthetase